MHTDLLSMSTERLNSLFQWLERTGTEAEAFTREQAPLVANEIIRWHLWSRASWSIPLFLLGLVLFPLIWKHTDAASALEDPR